MTSSDEDKPKNSPPPWLAARGSSGSSLAVTDNDDDAEELSDDDLDALPDEPSGKSDSDIDPSNRITVVHEETIPPVTPRSESVGRLPDPTPPPVSPRSGTVPIAPTPVATHVAAATAATAATPPSSKRPAPPASKAPPPPPVRSLPPGIAQKHLDMAMLIVQTVDPLVLEDVAETLPKIGLEQFGTAIEIAKLHREQPALDAVLKDASKIREDATTGIETALNNRLRHLEIEEFTKKLDEIEKFKKTSKETIAAAQAEAQALNNTLEAHNQNIRSLKQRAQDKEQRMRALEDASRNADTKLDEAEARLRQAGIDQGLETARRKNRWKNVFLSLLGLAVPVMAVMLFLNSKSDKATTAATATATAEEISAEAPTLVGPTPAPPLPKAPSTLKAMTISTSLLKADAAPGEHNVDIPLKDGSTLSLACVVSASDEKSVTGLLKRMCRPR